MNYPASVLTNVLPLNGGLLPQDYQLAVKSLRKNYESKKSGPVTVTGPLFLTP